MGATNSKIQAWQLLWENVSLGSINQTSDWKKLHWQCDRMFSKSCVAQQDLEANIECFSLFSLFFFSNFGWALNKELLVSSLLGFA